MSGKMMMLGMVGFLFFLASIVLVGKVQLYAIGDVPNVQFSFQIPSYVINKDPVLDSYICDPSKPECKINFDLTPSFTGGYKSSDFICEIQGIDPSESAKCNPNTVTFSSGITTVVFIIRNKSTPVLSMSRSIQIHNGDEIINTDSGMTNTGQTSSGAVESNTGTSSDGSLSNSGLTETGTSHTGGLPVILFSFQQATYLLDKNPLLHEFFCDTMKTECKVNLSLEDTFTGGFRESDYVCHIDGITESESGKCNPNQVTFGTGLNTLVFTVSDKLHPELSVTRQILIHGFVDDSSVPTSSSGAATNSENASSGAISHTGMTDSGTIIESSSGSSGTGESLSGGTVTGVIVPEPSIVIQSGLSPDMTCNKEDCVVNFDGEQSFLGFKMSDYHCLWNFTGATVAPDISSCNPGYVHYGSGEYQVSFQIISKSKPEHLKRKMITLKNVYAPVIKSTSSGGAGTSHILPQAVITPQGPWGVNKYVRDSKVICYTQTGTCSVNFTGEESVAEHITRLQYSWLLPNGGTADSSNPGAFSLPVGEYEIVLHVKDEYGITSEARYPISVLTYMGANLNTEPDGKYQGLEISRVNPNPVGSDVFEWVEIQNSSSNTIGLQKCYLQETSGTKYVFSPSEQIVAGERKKLVASMIRFSLSNTRESLNLYCENQLVSQFSWNISVPEGYIFEKQYMNQSRQKGIIDSVDGTGMFQLNLNGLHEHYRLLGVNFDMTSSGVLDIIKERYIGKEVDIEYEKDNREYVYIWRDEKNIGEELIYRGLVRYELRELYMFKKVFENASKDAMKDFRGFWGDEPSASRAKKLIYDVENTQGIEIDESDMVRYVEWLKSGSGTSSKQKAFLEHVTTLETTILDDGSLECKGKGYSGSIISLRLDSGTGVIGSGSSRIALSDSGSVSAKVNEQGEWIIRITGLSPGKYFIYQGAQIASDQNFILLGNHKTIIIGKKEKVVPMLKKSGGEKDNQPADPAVFSLLLQAGRSKKIAFENGRVICHDKKCGVNLEIKESEKGAFVYEWDFGRGEKIYGKNPKSISFSIGKHVIILKALNIETGELISQEIPVQIIPPPKKPKKKRSIPAKKTNAIQPNFRIKTGSAPFVERSQAGVSPYVFVVLTLIFVAGFSHLVWKQWGKVGAISDQEIDSTFPKK